MMGWERYTIMSCLLVTVVLAGCGSSRDSASVHKDIVRKTEARESLSGLRESFANLTALTETDMGIRISYVTYDTSKPADPETKLPPVSGSGTVDIDFGQTSESSYSSADSCGIQLEMTRDENETDKSKEETSEEKEIGNPFGDIKGIILAIASVLFVIYSRKLVKKIMFHK